MKLVTTYFSSNSKGAIRFALNLAKQSKNIEVVFYHAIYIQQSGMQNNFFEGYKEKETVSLSANFKKFIYLIIGKNIEKISNVKFVIDNCISKEKYNIQYAKKINLTLYVWIHKGLGFLEK